MGALPVAHKLALTSPFLPRHRRPRPTARSWRRRHGAVVAYMEPNPNSPASIAGRLIGAFPVVGLVARILSDEGGVGGDIIDFAEFRRRVSKKCTVMDSQAFYDFNERRGKPGDPFYVLLCCWLAAVGGGLLKTEEILEGVARLRISNDIEFEEETFIDMMRAAKEKRAKLKAPTPQIPMEARAEKALEAIYICCFWQDMVEEEDEKLLCTILNAVFPSVGRPTVERMVSAMAEQVASGERKRDVKNVSKEVVQRQLKDLEFLKQNKLD
ncbi:photosystem I assembly factor PSA3, chloroplastic-like [Phragmites australis]|uniref:photosystem I assembly factor PSA3, chloroplastic-like n=1 Tax=Phragmites australis TaxID=29695 RepID=UPI002D76995F|nr:photosystem I assembly factor PSA3, chloroplastic-like [Phragmites australis]